MRLVLVSALLSLTACPAPDVACLPKPGLLFPSGVIAGAPETIVTTTARLELSAPPVSCIPADSSIVTVSATLSGGGRPTRSIPATIALSTRDESKITVDLVGAEPGEYFLQIFVEPTIAAISRDVIIAVDRTRPAQPRLEPSCPGRAGRTAWGTPICSDGSPRFIARTSDGGTKVFDGTGLTLARDVLWLERSTDAGPVVERHVERSPGQFERTHLIQLEGAPVDAADEHHVWAGSTFATTADDGSTSIQRTLNADRAKLRMIDEGRGLEFRLTDEICEMDGGCWRNTAFKGREIANVGSAVVWFEPEADGSYGGLVRPLSAARSSAITTHSFPSLQVDLFTNRSSRLRAPAALVLVPNTFDTLLIERRDGVFERWQPERGWALRDATDEIVEFDVSPGQVAVFRR
ncbi:MAG: hypothetical protein JNM69_28570 [Archangium sp.]|nr:hypothetical protein [Archangium sp.]